MSENKPDLMAELAEVVRLSSEATPGPWVEDDNEGFSPWIVWERMAPSGNGKPGKMIARLTGDSCEYDANAHLIAAAVNFLRTHHAELEAVVRDAALLDFQERECITIRCEAVDCHDVIYEAVEYHMEEPEERVIGTGPTPREALIQAMHNSAREG